MAKKKTKQPAKLQEALVLFKYILNLLVVLCGDDSAQPVVNTGTLNN